MFKPGNIHGVVVKNLNKYVDERGWLAECFRQDEIDATLHPVMSYISMTLPGIARGPHEHKEQTDYFCFLGPSNFKIMLWDKREDSPTKGVCQTIFAGKDAPKSVIIPPGVIHAYKNIGVCEGFVLNFPNKLYKGTGKKEEVDEIRYENDINTPYKIGQE